MATVEKTLTNNAYTSNIGQRLFAYTYYGDVINKTIADQFKKSLIFLGYEGQIWSPLTNTYVGIGKTAYDITTAYVQDAHAKIDALNTALTSSLVSSIYANWGEDDWKNTTNGPAASGVDDGWESKIGASNKIVLKGIGDYDTVNDYRMNVEYAHVTDQNSDQQDKLDAATRPLDNAGDQWATSGITVSLTKGKNWYRWERLANSAQGSSDVAERDANDKVTKWADHVENGKVAFWAEGEATPTSQFDGITFEATDGASASAEKMTATCYVPVYNGSNRVYKNGKNVFTIDDTQTWSYITARNAEIMQMTKDYTSSEVNRIYAELLGIKNGGIIPVSYNQIWNVAANENASNADNGADDVVAVAIPDNKIYFKKVTIDLDGTAGEFIPQGLTVTPFEVDSKTFYYLTTKTGKVAYEYSYFAQYYDKDTNVIDYVLGVDSKIGNEITFIKDLREPAENTETNADGTLTKSEDGTITPTPGRRAQYNLPYIYERIKTINEVTPGSQYFLYDASLSSATDNVNLADGINTLKEVAHVLDLITNGSLETGNPENSGIELAYSIAQNHVDIIDLDKRLDKLEAGENAVRSLREATDGPHLDLHLDSETKSGDKYYQDVTITASLNLAYTHSNADTVAREKVFVPTWNKDATGNITLAYTVDGNTTVPTLVNRTHEGLVTTSWALSYGVELRQAIVANDIELNKHLAYAHSYALINALDGTYTTSKSKLVDGYTQTNGKVEVSYRELPTDHITASATVWGESGDTALKVYAALTDNIVSEAIALQTPIYKVDGVTYVKTSDITQNNIETLYFLDADQTFKQVGTYIGTGKKWTDNAIAAEYASSTTSVNHFDVYKTTPRYVRVDSADLTIDADGKASGDQLYIINTEETQPKAQVKYISASAVHHNDEAEAYNDGSNTFHVTAHITKISDATASNSGLADAYDVRNAIDNIFGWVDLSEWATNNPLNRTGETQQA